MTTIPREISNKIANMSLVCACLVVMIHFPHDETASLHYFYDIFPGAYSKIAVPFFFCVSGYLLVGNCEEQGWWKTAIKKRLKTLVIPYLSLNLLFGIWRVVRFAFLASLFGTPAVLPTWKTPLECFGLLPMGDGPALFVLWYVRCLLFLVLFSPLIVEFIKRCGRILPALIAALLILSSIRWSAFAGYFGQYFCSASALGYFSLGILLRFGPFHEPHIIMGGVFFVVSFVIKVFLADIESLMQLGNVFGIIGIWSFTPSNKWPVMITSCSFPIYVFHFVLIEFFWIIMRHLGLMGYVTGVCFCNISSLAFIIVVSAMTANIIRKYFPCIHTIILGGR